MFISGMKLITDVTTNTRETVKTKKQILYKLAFQV